MPRAPVDWRRVPMAYGRWTALIGDEGGVKVEKTTRHVIVWCESITGQDPDELLLRAKSMADRVAASLCAKYGFKLGSGRLVPKKHIGVYDPAAELLSRYFEVSDDVGKIDRSEGLGEIDQEILNLLRHAPASGILPRDIAREVQCGLTPWKVTLRIRRMNKKLDKQISQKVAEKRGLCWALTSFTEAAWED